MAAFRPVTPLTVFLDNLGVPVAGGELRFFETGTDDEKDVYSEEDLSVNLGPTVTLDSAGRAPSDIWGVGVYRVRLYTDEAVLVDEADPVQEEGAAGSAIPSQTGHSGKALFTDGSVMSWLDVSQLPDMTGQAGKVLGTDGASAIWETPADAPDVPADGVTQDSTSITVGKYKIQNGSGTAPASGTYTTTLAVVFPTAYTTCLHVDITVTSALSGGPTVAQLTAPPGATGFTVSFDVAEGAAVNSTISAPVTFTWQAHGIIP